MEIPGVEREEEVIELTRAPFFRSVECKVILGKGEYAEVKKKKTLSKKGDKLTVSYTTGTFFTVEAVSLPGLGLFSKKKSFTVKSGEKTTMSSFVWELTITNATPAEEG